MRMTPGRILIFLRYAARPRIFPRATAHAHVVRLDVDAPDPEGILAHILVKIKVNESPIKRCVEDYRGGRQVASASEQTQQ